MVRFTFLLIFTGGKDPEQQDFEKGAEIGAQTEDELSNAISSIIMRRFGKTPPKGGK